MRRRLIASTLLIVLVAIVVLGVPLLVLARHQVWSTANQRLHQQTANLAADYEDRLSANEPVDLSDIATRFPGDRVIVRSRGGRQQFAGSTPTGRVRAQSVAVAGGSVTVEMPAGATIAKVRQVTLLIAGLAVLALLAGVALAMRQARQLAAPLATLATRADALGAGDFSAHELVTGVPEVDAIARVLDRSASQISAYVELQRQFAADAAHQLRTPLTGIGLRLDEIAQIGSVASKLEAEAALTQVERLNAVITTLLARAKGDAADPAIVDLADLVRHEAASWRDLLAANDRELVLALAPAAVVRARPDHIVGVLNSLLDNAIVHGRGDVTIAVSHDAHNACMSVADQGAGVPSELKSAIFTRSVSGFTGTGIGLALARSLAAGEGGTLDLAASSPAELQLRLPLATGSLPRAMHPARPTRPEA